MMSCPLYTDKSRKQTHRPGALLSAMFPELALCRLGALMLSPQVPASAAFPPSHVTCVHHSPTRNIATASRSGSCGSCTCGGHPPYPRARSSNQSRCLGESSTPRRPDALQQSRDGAFFAQAPPASPPLGVRQRSQNTARRIPALPPWRGQVPQAFICVHRWAASLLMSMARARVVACCCSILTHMMFNLKSVGAPVVPTRMQQQPRQTRTGGRATLAQQV